MKQKMIEIETHSYNSYIAEVTALNSVKEFLSENRATLSGPLKQKLIQQIINMHKKIRNYERSHDRISGGGLKIEITKHTFES